MIIETCPVCGHYLIGLVLTVNPPISQKKCTNCGWSWTGEREEVIIVPFGGNSYVPEESVLTPNLEAFSNPSCVNCSNNPANGGSGICFCTLGLPKIT